MAMATTKRPMSKTLKQFTITDLTLDKKNANRGTDRGKKLLAESLNKLGAGRSIVCDRNGKVIGGNKTLEQALALGLEVEIIHTQGDKLVAVVRDDLDLDTDSKARELAYSDNRIAELDLSWDVDQILEDLDSITIDGLWTPEEIERLQNGLDLAVFEKLSDSVEDEELEEKASTTSNESDMVPFHCLLTQEQRERLFQAINQAKSQQGLETTAEALNSIAEEYLK